MFKSFFPKPKLLLLTVIIWVTLAAAGWYSVAEQMGEWMGFPAADPDAAPVLGLGHFLTPQFLWFYIYCAAFLFVFAAAWFILSPHRYQWWSILGSALILFSTYFSV